MAHDVFVSYASGDKTIADAVCGTLEANGVRCWIAPRDVEPGMAYGESIIEAIQGCRVMVLVFSSRANVSVHIPKELERAVSTGASVIPLRIEDVKPGKSLDYFIGNVHWLDALKPPLDAHLQRLAKNVKTILSRDDTVTEQTGAFIAARVAEWSAKGGGAKEGASAGAQGTTRKDTASAQRQAKRPTLLYALLGTLTILVIVFAALYFLRRPIISPNVPPAVTTNNMTPASSPKPRSVSSGSGHQKNPAAPQTSSTAQSPVATATPAADAARPPADSAPSKPTAAPTVIAPPVTTPPASTKAPSTPPAKDDAKTADQDEANSKDERQGEALVEKGDYDGAIAKYREIIRQHPSNAVAHSNLSGALRLKGDLDGAIAEANEAIHIKPHLAVAHTALAMALGKKGDLDGAIAQYRETIRIKPDLPNVHHLLGLALMRKNDVNDAIAEFRETVKLKPDFAEAHFNLARALTAKGDKAGAAQEYSEARRLDPKYSQP
jgi:Flp pilus assembly protein TadD